MLDLAGYLIEAGPIINDGDTIGPEAATKVVVRHEASGFVPGQPVYRLHFQKRLLPHIYFELLRSAGVSTATNS
ncbi:MAG: hypothetical protein HZB28_11365 [Methylocystis sp.]|nr:hypothetical protein [Methylocystis sp.]